MTFQTNLVTSLDQVQGARLSWSQANRGYTSSIFVSGLDAPHTVAAKIADALSDSSSFLPRNLYLLCSWLNRGVPSPPDAGQEPKGTRLLFLIKYTGVAIPYTKGIWVPAMLAATRDAITARGEAVAAIYRADPNVESCTFLIPFD